MGPDYKHDRLSDNFINLTDIAVNLYEYSSGQIWTFPPSTDPLPEAPVSEPGTPLLHYIVSPEMAEEIGKSGRPLADIAITGNVTHGRHGRAITKLHWGKDPSKIVRLYHGFQK